MDRFPDDSPRMHAKREQIRQAALVLFLQRGFERTTIDAIVETAPVSKQTLYRYYQSKEDLFASDGVPHSPTPERIAEIVQLFLQAMP